MTDIEIQKSVKLKNIIDIAKKAGLKENDIECYGKYKAKIGTKAIKKFSENKDGKLILVTAMSPTPMGEGKTTVSIAIADALK